jgi:hypothetical protein
VDEVNQLQADRRTNLCLCVDFLNRYRRTDDDTDLRIALRYARTAAALEDRIDAGLMAAIKREVVPAP